MKLKLNQAEMPYKSPESVTLEIQGESVLCSSGPSQSINDFSYEEDDWN